MDPSTRGRGEEAAKGTGVRRYLCRQRPLEVFRWYSRASWKVSVRIKAPAARGALRTASRGRHADRPFDEPATITARRTAAATWMMPSTTVASRAYAVVPARQSRCSRGASRTSSAPAAGSARHRPDAGRGAARSPDAQPAACQMSFPCDFRARTTLFVRHRPLPLGDNLERLLLAAPGGRRGIRPFERLDRTLYRNDADDSRRNDKPSSSSICVT